MQLTAAPLNALTPAADLFSLIPALGATPAASTNSSVAIAHDFSALLTELTGTGSAQGAALPPEMPFRVDAETSSQASPSVLPMFPTAPAQPGQYTTVGLKAQVPMIVQNAQPGLPWPPVGAGVEVSTSQTSLSVPPMHPAELSEPMQHAPARLEVPAIVQNVPEPPLQLPLSPDVVVDKPVAAGLQKAKVPQKPDLFDNTSSAAASVALTLFAPVVVASPAADVVKPINIAESVPEPPPVVIPQAAPQPEEERAFAEVKKFEVTFRQVVKPAEAGSLQPAVDPQKQPIVTTDPIANVQQQQIPPRVLPIQKIAMDPKLPQRGKPEPTSTDTASPTPTTQFTDLVRPVDRLDQAAPAHYVEVPNLPHLQVVRTVFMEVGEAESQVMIHIQDRGGDVTMQLNAGSDSLHQDLQTSLGSLMTSLKHEQVPVSTVEVSRKSPIDKVRRMKEAH